MICVQICSTGWLAGRFEDFRSLYFAVRVSRTEEWPT